MGLHLNWTGKMLLGALGVQLALKAIEAATPRHSTQRDPDETYGLPRPVFDELSRLAWEGNRSAYMSRLDAIGAPPDVAFRTKLWSLLGGD
jgi:hypothetical protein